jgi:hypothetical protein
MSQYGTWSQGVFTDNAGNVYQDTPTVGDNGGWSRAVAADGPALGELFKSIFASLGPQKPQGPSNPQMGTQPVMQRRANIPVFARPNAGMPELPQATFNSAAMPMIARPGTPQMAMPFDEMSMTLGALKQRAPAKGYIIG